MKLSPPAGDQFELSVFGPGYGESQVVHLCDNRWLIVDSCLDRHREPAPLAYLRQLKVDFARVELVVATHWHDDHVRGLSAVLDACPNAAFVCSSAWRRDEFLQLISREEKPTDLAISSGVAEASQIVDILQSRGTRPQWAIRDRLVWSEERVRVLTLSPSDDDLEAAVRELAKIPTVTHGQPVLRIASPSRNHASVACLIQTPQWDIILGGDVETGSSQTGWTHVRQCSRSLLPNRTAAIKVPHHGSKTAFDRALYQQFMLPDFLATVTPFMRGSSCVPSAEELKALKRACARLWCTASHSPKKVKISNNLVRQRLGELSQTPPLKERSMGHVRLRMAIGGFDEWQVEYDAPAFLVPDTL